MILADTSVWIDHLRGGHIELAELLTAVSVVVHPWVIGELALGGLLLRSATGTLLRNLPSLPVANDDEVLGMIESRALAGRGIGFVDAHLVAATLLQPGTRLWTQDRRLAEVAAGLGVGRGAGGSG